MNYTPANLCHKNHIKTPQRTSHCDTRSLKHCQWMDGYFSTAATQDMTGRDMCQNRNQLLFLNSDYIS